MHTTVRTHRRNTQINNKITFLSIERTGYHLFSRYSFSFSPLSLLISFVIINTQTICLKKNTTQYLIYGPFFMDSLAQFTQHWPVTICVLICIANGFQVRIFNKLCPAGTDTGLNAVGSVRKKGNKSEKY